MESRNERAEVHRAHRVGAAKLLGNLAPDVLIEPDVFAILSEIEWLQLDVGTDDERTLLRKRGSSCHGNRDKRAQERASSHNDFPSTLISRVRTEPKQVYI